MRKDSGFTLFIAITVMGTLLLVSTGLVTLAVKQGRLAASSRDSQAAFYAADSGMECAIYWDIKNPTGVSAFATSTGSAISCNGNPLQAVGGNPQSSFSVTFPPDPYCAMVTVTKNPDNTTRIESLGYNTCDASNPRRVERAVRASY